VTPPDPRWLGDALLEAARLPHGAGPAEAGEVVVAIRPEAEAFLTALGARTAQPHLAAETIARLERTAQSPERERGGAEPRA